MRFWKYQGLGNDFILLDGMRGDLEVDMGWCRKACDRNFGIGGDGVLYMLPGENGCDITMRIINADGSEAEMCGNGIRCFAKHAYDFGYIERKEFSVWTMAGKMVIDTSCGDDGKVDLVTVNMGKPELNGRKVPVDMDGECIDLEFEREGIHFRGSAVSMGNPHFITFDDISEEDRLTLGPAIEKDGFFPNKTNVEFATVDDGKIDIKVFERGAGWTLACGTGACATTVAAWKTGRVDAGVDVPVHLPGGWLNIRIEPQSSEVYMQGPAELVFSGETE